MSTTTLYRPVGLRELELILDADARAFPPRLAAQPIFYPVLNATYAARIAREWNPGDAASGFAGFVTEFEVDAEYLTRFEPRTVGTSEHRELWVPASELPSFNEHLRSRVRVTAAFYGPAYEGPVAVPSQLRACRLRNQLAMLHGLSEYNAIDFGLEIAANWKLVLANHGFWSVRAAEEQGLTPSDAARTLTAIRKTWEQRHPDLPLPAGTPASCSTC